ncbi:MAG: iron-sulfur cluster assembly accessory protein [Verrucomicrobia bacterium]|nr:iron-sulfur cluster assembly accessory protein [Verrucomicrobiota bacterium]MDA1086865.1 iron-sulfur cluster assembly accessory protein [Verrucomicrobiota bacterium]
MNTTELKDVIGVTEAAAREVKRLIEEDGRGEMGLRLGIKGGGCSGLSYVIDLDAAKDNDILQPSDGFDIYMDRKSSLYLKDVTLDFEGGLQDRGFKFINPAAKNTCGCGTSFSV